MHAEAYLDKDSDYFGWGRPEMLPFIPEGITSLLDVGCASGAFGAMLKAHRSIRITGIEPHQESALVARTAGSCGAWWRGSRGAGIGWSAL